MKNVLRLSVALLVAFPSASAPAAAKALDKVRVGTSPALSSMGFFIAKEKGYFAAEGIEADITIFKSTLADILPLVATGRLDVGGEGLSAGFYNAVIQGTGIKLVADKGHTPFKDGYKSMIFSKKLYPGRLDAAALKGRSFAVPMKGFESEILIERFLQRYGLGFKDIEMTTLSYPNVNAALANGALFGAVQIEPFLSAALREGYAVDIMNSSEIYPGQQGGAVFYSGRFMTDRRDVAVRFMAAYLKGTRWFNDYLRGRADKKEFFEILKKYTTMDDAGLVARMRYPALNPNGYINLKSAEDDLRWYHEHGTVPKLPEMKDLVDHSFVDEALKRLGRYEESGARPEGHGNKK